MWWTGPDSKIHSLVITHGWVTSAASYVAKEVYWCALSFHSAQLLSRHTGTQQRQNVSDHGASAIFGILHHTPLITLFFSQAQALHISLINLRARVVWGLDRCHVLRSVPLPFLLQGVLMAMQFHYGLEPELEWLRTAESERVLQATVLVFDRVLTLGVKIMKYPEGPPTYTFVPTS